MPQQVGLRLERDGIAQAAWGHSYLPGPGTTSFCFPKGSR